MSYKLDKTDNVSRRSILKRSVVMAIAGLFGFVPTVKHLTVSKPVLAYIPCSIVDCVYLGKKCVQGPCGPATWVEAYDCQDIRTREHCYYRTVDTGKPCP